MPNHPLLIFGASSNIDRSNKPWGTPKISFPNQTRQKANFNSNIRILNESINLENSFVTSNMPFVDPEFVLVFEIVGSINEFYKAVSKISDLEFLTDVDIDEIDPDDSFYVYEIVDGRIVKKEGKLSGKLFFVSSNMRVVQRLRNLWRLYETDELPYGTAKWKDLFKMLKTIRLWDVNDRLDKNILQDWNERRELGEETIKFEIQAWFKKNPADRTKIREDLVQLLSARNNKDKGRILKECIIEQIHYHGFLVEAPIFMFDLVGRNPLSNILRYQNIMFFNPVGHTMDIHGECQVGDLNSDVPTSEDEINPEPVVALLDGYPLSNHDYLKDFIIIDDPDNFQADYNTGEQIHGTNMASIIIWGDNHDNTNYPLNRKILVLPVMKPDPNDFNVPRQERIPENFLVVDLFHKIIKNIFENDETKNIKIINISLADYFQPFVSSKGVSNWGKLLDYFAFKYKVLINVCVGNYPYDYTTSFSSTMNPQPTPVNIQNETLKLIITNQIKKKILAPSDSINSLSIGGYHSDRTNQVNARLVDLFNNIESVSPISRNGLGFKRSVKPDILMPAGKILYEKDLTGQYSSINYKPKSGSYISAPGIKGAYGGTQGSTNGFRYTFGTSNSTALTTRLSAQIFEFLNHFLVENDADELYFENIALLIKCLIIHNSSWDSSTNLFKSTLTGLGISGNKHREFITMLFGHGTVNEGTLYNCTDERITFMSVNQLEKGKAHEYKIPLPDSLSGERVLKRFKVSLVYFTPINPANSKYKIANLWFNLPPENDYLNLTRVNVDDMRSKLGTVQHAILENDNAVSFAENSELIVKVNCEEYGGKLLEKVPYALVCTLEVGENINIYQEILNKIQAPVRVEV